MSQAKDILEAALKLEPAERAHLAHELLNSIDDATDLGLSPAWEEEIQRRLHDMEAGRSR